MDDIAFRQYDENTLKRLQDTELEVLIAFDNICRDLNLRYFVHYGALIGALRHRGPIPWDDDIDVAIPRDDFMAIVSYCDSHPDLPYGYMDPAHKDNCTKTVPLFYKKGTVFAEDDIGWQPGIGVDLFPFDYLPEDERLRAREIRRANIQRRLMFLCFRNPRIPLSGWKYYAATVVCNIMRALLTLFRIRGSSIFRLFEQYNLRSNEKNRGSTFATSFFSANPEKSTLNPKQFEVVDIPYAGTEVRGPNDPDVLLKSIYGDYMQLPPENQRINHRPLHLDFGDGKGDVLHMP